MTEYRTDLVMRMIEDIARLTAQAVTMQQLGLQDDLVTQLVILDEQANKLDPEARARVEPALERLREQIPSSGTVRHRE